MWAHSWRASALVSVLALVVVLATTAPGHARTSPQRPAEPTSATQAVPSGAESAALRTQSGVRAERWLEERSAKSRALPLVAVLAAVLGVLLVGRRRDRDVTTRSSSLPLRRHAVALRAPPHLQPA